MSYLEAAEKALADLRSHTAHLPGGNQEPTQPGRPPSGHGPAVNPQQVAAMTLEEFARAGLKLRVHSQVLGCDVLFISDNVPDDEIDARGLPVYRAHELRKLALLKPRPHSLRCIHEVKTVFGGTVEDVTDRESSR
ncbi:MAG: hypothetical protein HC897_05670 [Thermoanaerobaculia bacterium]|nr:hypothetical protein [Thermoanaerobaculia bacterium]